MLVDLIEIHSVGRLPRWRDINVSTRDYEVPDASSGARHYVSRVGMKFRAVTYGGREVLGRRPKLVFVISACVGGKLSQELSAVRAGKRSRGVALAAR